MADIRSTVVILLSCLSCVIATLTFTGQPEDIMVDKGGRVRLRCRIAGLNENYVVVWTKNHRNITIDSNIIGDRFTVDKRYRIIGGFKHGYFDLRIRDINWLDDGTYSCRVHERISKNATSGHPVHNNSTRILGRKVLQSVTGKVKVYYLPSYKYPHCPSKNGRRDVTVGEVVPVCFSDNGYPDINMALRDTENPLNILHEDPNRVQIEKMPSGFIFLTLNITQMEHNKSYLCVASSSEFPYYTQKCTVGPFNVQFKPRVGIRPLRYGLQSGEDAVFICEADANPAPASVQWSIYPPIDSSFVHFFDHNRTMHILKIKPEYDGRMLSCTVTNSRGSYTAKRILTINHDHSWMPPITVGPETTNVPGDTEPRCYLVFDILGPLLVGTIILLVLLIVLVLMKHGRNEKIVAPRRPVRTGQCYHKRISDMELSTSTASTVDEMSTMMHHKDNCYKDRTCTMQTIVDNN